MKKAFALIMTLFALTGCNNQEQPQEDEIYQKGTEKIIPAEDFKNTPVGEYEIVNSDLYGEWPDGTKMVIYDKVEKIVDPSAVFTKYLVHLNGDKNQPAILKVFVKEEEQLDVLQVSKFYVRSNGFINYSGQKIPLLLVDGYEY